MPRILMTGASGGIGTSFRKLLPPIYPDLLLSDLKAPADLGPDEKFKAADLADLAAGRGDLRGRRRHSAFRRLFGRRPLGCHPAVQHHRRLQSVRGGAQEGRQARRVCLLEPRDGVLSAPSPHRHRCDGAAGRPLRRQQGVRRSGWRALCRQARAGRDLHPDRQFRRPAAGSPPDGDLAEAGRPRAAVPDRARSSRHSFRGLVWRVVQ